MGGSPAPPKILATYVHQVTVLLNKITKERNKSIFSLHNLFKGILLLNQQNSKFDSKMAPEITSKNVKNQTFSGGGGGGHATRPP